MPVTDEIVKLENVWFHYNGTPILEGINLKIQFGDFLAIIGPNGGGKSTLLKVILGLIKPDRGTVTVFGKPVSQNHSHIGYVPQFALFDREFPITVWEVVMTSRYHRGWFPERYSVEDLNIVSEALKTADMMPYVNRQIGQLSGGEQQRVFIARALATSPKLLLLDEPTASVEPDMKTDFYELLKRLKTKMAILIVSHDISAVSIYVDQIACLNRQLIYHGSKEISPETLEKTYRCPVQLIAHGDIPHRVLKEHDR